MKIEDTVLEDSLPVNTIAMANRLIEILKENKTNCALALKKENLGSELIKFKKCLWLINSQTYGQMAKIDMCDEWDTFSMIDRVTKQEINQGLKQGE